MRISIGVLGVWFGLGLWLAFAGRAWAVDEPTKECPQCQGTGQRACQAACDKGLRNCPGKCLKLSVGRWEHLKVEGHAPTELWQKFPKKKGGYSAWNQNHVGEVVEIRDGEPVLAGKCPVCGGAAKIKCSACEGTGQAKCLLCAGTGQVAVSVQPVTLPGEYLLKDGRLLKGKITMQRGEVLMIRTEDGKIHTVQRSELVDPKAGRLR
jgi:hypothetical protein